jgi:hypothetical protein
MIITAINCLVPDNFYLRKSVQFAIVESSLASIPWQQVEDLSLHSPIVDLCSAISEAEIRIGLRQPIGYIPAESDSRHKQYVNLRGSSVEDPEQQSLEEYLTASSSSPIRSHVRDTSIFKRRDRLYLAKNLACSVPQFYETWLKAQWGARDILFKKAGIEGKFLFEQPHVRWRVPDNTTSRSSRSADHRLQIDTKPDSFPAGTRSRRAISRSDAGRLTFFFFFCSPQLS